MMFKLGTQIKKNIQINIVFSRMDLLRAENTPSCIFFDQEPYPRLFL